MRSPASSTRKVALLAGLDDRHGPVLALHLEGQGWTVKTVASGREAVSRCNELEAEVVVTDLDGRNLDGLELAGALAALQPRPTLVLWTSHPWAASLDAATLDRIGIDAVVPRPARLEAVAEALLRAADAAAARVAATPSPAEAPAVAKSSLVAA